MAKKLQLKRGNKINLPTLAAGEPAVTLDEGKVYIGAAEGNVGLARDDHTHDTITNNLTSHINNTNNPHGVTATQIGAVPTSRKVNNKALNEDIALTASDVSAAPVSHASSATTYGAASTSMYGHTKLSTSVSSTSTTLAATPSAVKQAYDKAVAAVKIDTGSFTSGAQGATSTVALDFEISAVMIHLSSNITYSWLVYPSISPLTAGTGNYSATITISGSSFSFKPGGSATSDKNYYYVAFGG